jgi:hypothetical protein
LTHHLRISVLLELEGQKTIPIISVRKKAMMRRCSGGGTERTEVGHTYMDNLEGREEQKKEGIT